jgi:hypothetical protein
MTTKTKIVIGGSVLTGLTALYLFMPRAEGEQSRFMEWLNRMRSKNGGANNPSALPSIVTDTGKKDGKGNRLVEVTGKGGNDDGKVVKGYELPNKISDNTFPIKIVAKPNGEIAGFSAGKTAVVTKVDEWTVRLGGKDTFYEALVFNTLRSE